MSDTKEHVGEGVEVPAAARPVRHELVVALVITLVGVLVAGGAFGLSRERYKVLRTTSGTMRPTFPAGTEVAVRKGGGAGVRRGDVVYVSITGWNPDPMNTLRRVIGVGGDHVVLGAGGPLQVNGEDVDEPYLYRGVSNGPYAVDIRVPQGRIFLLADDRTDSVDSRMHLSKHDGTVPVAEVIGRAQPGVNALVPYFVVMLLAALTAFASLVTSLVLWSRTRRVRRTPRPTPTVTWGPRP
ncbi:MULTISPECIES: signal peptidase I [unclassified Streptomyces]|uniref:signal peptidase I n=1 Tax=unclassified Streptomyces TaxID=2593676 RepID=UPI002E2B580D|nr:signal peptidase I [Streptomyces sp. NBC_00223]